MKLEMKPICEKCGTSLSAHGIAFICSFECTYCQNCTEQMEGVCPNCQGELVRRPRRRRQESDLQQTI